MVLIRILICLLLLFTQTPASFAAEGMEQVKIGVLAKRGADYTLKKWSNTADYLTQMVGGYHFSIVPLGFSEIHSAVQRGDISFVLANSAFYVELENLYGVSRIATLINRHISSRRTTIFGGVIFTRADREDINGFDDLRGQSFLAVDPRSFGGWIMAWRELKRADIDPAVDLASLNYSSTHDAVVHGVLKKEADAGTVRSDTLERMAAEGTINLDRIKVLKRRQVEGFPFLLSTDLYPEWPIGVVATTSNELAKLVAAALITMDPNHPAALASKSAGWTIPLNYQDVHKCLLDLRIGPYRDYGKITLKDVLIRFKKEIIAITGAVVIIILTLFYILKLNRRLTEKKLEVDELNRSLEAKVIKRTKKIDNLLDQEIYLREIMQTVADINELLITSTSVEQLLQEACERFTGHAHYGFCWIGRLREHKITELFSSGSGSDILDPLPYFPYDPEADFYTTPTAECIVLNKTVVKKGSGEEKGTVSLPHKRPPLGGYAAEVCLPLRAEKLTRPLGALSVYTLRKAGFEPEEIAMLEELAGDIGFAVHAFEQKEAVKKLEIERMANYEQTIYSFVNMIEHRDTYTAGHTSRVAQYCELIGKQLGVGKDDIGKLQKAAILHDIGKIATPDSVLLKPGTLSSLDYDLIKLHAKRFRINIYKISA